MAKPSELPAALLSAPSPARLKHFQDFTVAHPRLVDAKDRLLAAIRESAPNSVILVLGPTGVGKTTLRMRVEQLLTAESLAALQADPARLPVVSVEAVAPPSGNFNWRDHFRRMLYEMNEPLIDQKRKMEGCDVDVHFMPSIKAHGEQYHYAVEQALVLFGTYDLLAFRNLSGQLSRRSVDVHFCRYRASNAEDRGTFLNVLGSFERQMPLPEPPELVAKLIDTKSMPNSAEDFMPNNSESDRYLKSLPVRAEARDLLSGRLQYRVVEIEGVVRTAEINDRGRLLLTIRTFPRGQ